MIINLYGAMFTIIIIYHIPQKEHNKMPVRVLHKKAHTKAQHIRLFKQNIKAQQFIDLTP